MTWWANDMTDHETFDWHRLTPAERFTESQKLWEVYLLLGGGALTRSPIPRALSMRFDSQSKMLPMGGQV